MSQLHNLHVTHNHEGKIIEKLLCESDGNVQLEPHLQQDLAH